MTAVVLREDSESLLAKVSVSQDVEATYSDAGRWLMKEATYLRKLAERMELAASRLNSAITRAAANGPGAATQAGMN
jgi:hypothetical protein